MSRKTLARIAIVMVVVFGLIVIVYPRIYAPDKDSTAPVEALPPSTPTPVGP